MPSVQPIRAAAVIIELVQVDDELYLLAVSVGLTGSALNRLYVMAKYKAINVKGQHYDKAADPFQLWFFVGDACLMLLWGLATTVILSAGMLGLL